uniref:AioR n=2 Tax=Paracoccus sp. SY TaxID=1330255 RepID=A0A0F6TN29_9RHOB|nr:AioR [Paracoccus sp. SY]
MGASIEQRLRLEGAEVVWLKLMQRAIGALRTPRAPIDAVICDIRLPDGTGEELFTTLCRTMTPPPFLFITGQGSIDQAVRLLQAGGVDYILKPFDMSGFLERLTHLLRPKTAVSTRPLLGVSPAARRVEELVALAAITCDPVMVRGARGTGKALVARRIHDLSDRCAAPFASVSLARSDNMICDLDCAVRQVGEGTLFVNGLERLTVPGQDWMMSWLDSGPLAQIIAACGNGMAVETAEGRFRADLFSRLDKFDIPIPPLAERPEDAVWLLHHLFAQMNARRNVPLSGISALAEQTVRSHGWPGNGRELRARLVQAMSTAASDMLFPSDLFPERRAAPDEMLPTLSEARDSAERAHILLALERTGGHLGEAARLLKVSRTTLWEKMQKLGL